MSVLPRAELFLCGQATRIVQQLHVFLVPSLNPDGFDQRNRGNPNGVDLNRDFPDQFFVNNNDLATRQAETLALMKWTLSHRFTAGASLHEVSQQQRHADVCRHEGRPK